MYRLQKINTSIKIVFGTFQIFSPNPSLIYYKVFGGRVLADGA